MAEAAGEVAASGGILPAGTTPTALFDAGGVATGDPIGEVLAAEAAGTAAGAPAVFFSSRLRELPPMLR